MQIEYRWSNSKNLLTLIYSHYDTVIQTHYFPESVDEVEGLICQMEIVVNRLKELKRGYKDFLKEIK